MKLPRRQFLRLAAGTAVLPLPRIAGAQAYPARPVRIIVGFPAGTFADLIARQLGQWLSDQLGQPFVIDNRPGAGSNIAAEAVVKSPPDGYTLLLITAANTISVTLYDKLNFKLIRDIAPVAGVSRNPFVMEVNPSVPAKTVPEFIAYAKGNPGKIAMASSGNGTLSHVAGELFKMMTGVDMIHVPYRGDAPSLTDLLSGQVQLAFQNIPASIEHIRTGKLRALAVTSAARQEMLSELPTVGEFFPGYEASGWAGLGAPKHTPTEIIAKLNKEINSGLADRKVKAWFANQSNSVLTLSPAEFGKLIAQETEKWGKVIRAANIKAE
jgi:tripartite-type tricarboxylate transporter receptor subunit TctC